MSRRPSKKTTKRHAAKSTKSGRSPARMPAKKKTTKKSCGAAAASTTMRDRALTQLQFARGVTNKLAAGFSDAQSLEQPANCPNTLLWTFGHLACTASWLASLVDGKPQSVPGEWDKLFGMGSKPSGDKSGYPALAEVRKAFEDTYTRLVNALSAKTDAELLTPVAGEPSSFVKDKLDAAFKCAWHEGWHTGQLADLRRACGLPSAF